MFCNEIKLLIKNKSILILSLLPIAITIIICYFHLMDYSTIIYYENNNSEIFYGLEAYDKQKIINKNRKYHMLENNLIEKLIINIEEINKDKIEEEKEPFYKEVSPYLQGVYLLEKLNTDTGGELFETGGENGSFYHLREEVLRQKISHLDSSKQKLFEDLNADVKIPFIYGDMDSWPQMLSDLSMIGLLMISVLGISASSNFSELYENGSYEIILSTQYGRQKMVGYKIMTHVLWNLVIGFICIMLYLTITFKYISLAGGESSIQMIGLYSPYNLTLLSVLKLLVLFIFVGIISATILANYISMCSKNSVISIGVFILMLLVHVVQSYYLRNIDVGVVKVIRKILSLIPMASADIYYELLGFNTFKIWSFVVPLHYFKLVMNVVGSIGLFVLCQIKSNK